MRLIRGRNGLVVSAADHVASGLVAGGHAVYVTDEGSGPARRRNTKRRRSAETEQQSNGEAGSSDGPSDDAGSAGDAS